MTKRAGPDDSGDSERLPWLEPYREPAAKLAAARNSAPKPASSKTGRGALWSIVVAALIAAAAGGGYWLGQRGERPVPTPPSLTESRPPVPLTPPPPEAPPVTNIGEPAAEPEAAPKPVVEPEKQRRSAERITPKPPRKATIRKADTRRTNYDRVTAKQRQAARTWPKMPSPGPAGQVIQLGAFSTRARAQAAYRERTARYPLLGGMPQVIVPIITRPRGEVLYVLRLGTQTRQQSQVVCRNLRRSGDHCLVIG